MGGGGGGVYYTRPSLPIAIKYKYEPVGIRASQLARTMDYAPVPIKIEAVESAEGFPQQVQSGRTLPNPDEDLLL